MGRSPMINWKLHGMTHSKAWLLSRENRQDKYSCGVCDAELISTDFAIYFIGIDLPVQKAQEFIDLGAYGHCVSCKNRLATGGEQFLCLSCDTVKHENVYNHDVWLTMWETRSFTKAMCLDCITNGMNMSSKTFPP